MRTAAIGALLTVLSALITVVGVAPAQAAGGIVIYKAYYDSPGSDGGSNYSLNGEYIALKNTSSTAKWITGWTLRDATGYVYTFPSTRVSAGRYMRVRTGKGTNDYDDRYWGRSWYVWNNTGDKAYLRNSNGTLIDYCSWTSSDTWKYC